METAKTMDKAYKQMVKLLKILLLLIAILCMFIFVRYEFFDVAHKVEKSIQNSIGKEADVEFNDYQLVISFVVDKSVTEETELLAIKRTIEGIKEINPDTSIVVYEFWVEMGTWEFEKIKQVGIGMSNVASTDWTQEMTYKEFKEAINWY